MGALSDLLLHEPEGQRASSLEDIFSEEPVPLEVFVGDRKFLGNPPLSPKQYEAVRHIERIYHDGWIAQPETEEDPNPPRLYVPSRDLYTPMGEQFGAYWAEPIRMTNMITLQWGKGSGKDHICRIASLRIAYLLLCLRSPQSYFNMPMQDTITMLNIASSSNQAMSAFFTPMTRAVQRGWFADKCEDKQQRIVFDKNVEAVSGHSDAEGQEGGNLILGIADEIDAFRSKAELEQYRPKAVRESPRSAEAILKMMKTSASTRFPETHKNVRISYPRFLGSTIQRLTEQGRSDIERRGTDDPGRASRHYVSGPWATWDINPNVAGRQSFRDDYDDNPDMAKAMYECKPTRAVDTYFKNVDAVRAAMVDAEPKIEIEYVTKTIKSQETGALVRVWEPSYTFHPDFKPIQGARYAIHGDLAVKADRAGVAMSHVAAWERGVETTVDEDGAEIEIPYERPIMKTDFVISFAANLREDPPREIQVRWVRQLVFELLRRGFNVEHVSYDGFQSVDSLQILAHHGIEAERYSVDRTDEAWKTWRDLMYDGRHTMPFSIRLLEELESLGRFGGKVDHPPGGSKDEADAVAGSVVGALLLGGEEDPDGAVAYPGMDGVEVGGSFMQDSESSFELPLGLDYELLQF